MKIKDKKQLVGKTITELQAECKKLALEIAAMHQERMQGKVKNTSAFTTKRKDIAVIKTIMREKQIAEQSTERRQA